MFLVGLTGGISSGKSTVSSMLRELGCPIIDADVVARKGLWILDLAMPKTRTHALMCFLLPPFSKYITVFPAELLTEDIVEMKRRRLPACPTSLTKLGLVWLCSLHYWSGHAEAQACRTFIKTNAWRERQRERAHIMTSVCRWLQGWCCGFVLETERSQK